MNACMCVCAWKYTGVCMCVCVCVCVYGCTQVCVSHADAGKDAVRVPTLYTYTGVCIACRCR